MRLMSVIKLNARMANLMPEWDGIRGDGYQDD